MTPILTTPGADLQAPQGEVDRCLQGVQVAQAAPGDLSMGVLTVSQVQEAVCQTIICLFCPDLDVQQNSFSIYS